MMDNREAILIHIGYILADKLAIIKETELNLRILKSADSAINYWVEELKLLDLVEFCNTGKYPD